MKLSRPLLGLLIAGEELEHAVKVGQKTITIRKGHRDYQPGDTLLIGCHLRDWARLAKVTNVSFTTLEDVSEKDLKDDGFSNAEHALSVLTQWYPDMDFDSPVTVLRWDLVLGEV